LNGFEPDLSGVSGLLKVEKLGNERILTVKNVTGETLEHLRGLGIHQPDVFGLSLEDVFVESVRSQAL
jgi:hypothetical protein